MQNEKYWCHTLLNLLRTILLYILHDSTLYRQLSHTTTDNSKTGNDVRKLYLRYSQSIKHLLPLKFQSIMQGVFEHDWNIDQVHNQLKCPQVQLIVQVLRKSTHFTEEVQ